MDGKGISKLYPILMRYGGDMRDIVIEMSCNCAGGLILIHARRETKKIVSRCPVSSCCPVTGSVDVLRGIRLVESARLLTCHLEISTW